MPGRCGMGPDRKNRQRRLPQAVVEGRRRNVSRDEYRGSGGYFSGDPKLHVSTGIRCGKAGPFTRIEWIQKTPIFVDRAMEIKEVSMITETKPTIETPEPQALKDAVRKFWGTLPCGVSHSAKPTDSHAFFEETEKHRFQIHTNFDRPFLKEAINFKEHTGKNVLEIGVGIGVDALEWS